MKGRSFPRRTVVFGTFRINPVRCRRMACLAVLAAAALPARAATITLNAGDAGGSTSFNAAGNWSNNAAPTPDNDYKVAGGGVAAPFVLRTPAVAGNLTFAGNSLTLGDGGANAGALLYKGVGPTTDVITVNNLTANLGLINNGNGQATFTLAGSVTVQAGGLTLGVSGDGNGPLGRTTVVTAPISGPGVVNITSASAPYGSVVLNAANTYMGGTTVGNNATLRVAQTAALPGLANGGTPLPVTLGNNATLSLFVGGPNDLSAADVDRVRANVTFNNGTFFGLDTTNATGGFTYPNNLSGSFGFAKTGANTLFLTGSNSYTGGTLLLGGNLNFANIGNLGGGVINFNGGTLQFATGNTTDITAATSVNFSGAGSIDTNGNNVTFANGFGGMGGFTKTGAGNLTLLGGATPANFFVRQGRVVLTGTNSSVTTTGYASFGQLGGDNGTLVVSGGAKLSVPADFNVADVSASTGTLLISDDTAAGTTVGVKTLFVGKSGTDSGAVNQTGGTFQALAAPGEWRIGGNIQTTDAAAIGTYDISGTATLTTTGNLQPGAYGVGQMTVSGAAVVTVGSFPAIGRFPGSKGTLTVLGGTFNQTGAGQFMLVGESGQGILNVSGTGTVNASAGAQLRVGNVTGTATPGVGIVNLGTGGTVLAKAVNTLTTATGLLNFHGGTLTSTVANGNFISGLAGAYIYPEGGTINTNGVDITVSQPLLAPGTDGVLSIPVATGGSGYVANPVITIAGSGVGATAIPVLTGGALSAVTITNPGSGYLDSGLTVTVAGGNPTTPATLGTPVLGSSASGALRKNGAGALTLAAANGYAGGTVVNGGRLAVGTFGALGTAGNVSLAAGTTLDLTALNGSGGFTLDVGRTLTSAGATVTGQLNVSGVYQSTGASSLSGGLTVNNGGVVGASGGTLTLGGAVVNNGTIRMIGGAVLAASGATSFVNNGVIDLIDGSAQFPGNFSNGNGGVVITSSDVRVTAVSRTASGVSLQIKSVTGFNYQLQRSPELGAAANYVNVGVPQAGSTGATLTFTDPAPTGTRAFYRVVLSR